MTIDIDHVVEPEECEQADNLAKALGHWLSEQNLSRDVVDGALGIFLANVLDSSNRHVLRTCFQSGATLTITLIKAKDKEAQDDNTST